MTDYIIFAVLFGLGCAVGWWWRNRESDEDAENRVAFWRELAGHWEKAAKGRKAERAGFSTIGMLLLMTGMSLPFCTLAVALHYHVGVVAALGLVFLASAVGSGCAVFGNTISKQKSLQ